MKIIFFILITLSLSCSKNEIIDYNKAIQIAKNIAKKNNFNIKEENSIYYTEIRIQLINNKEELINYKCDNYKYKKNFIKCTKFRTKYINNELNYKNERLWIVEFYHKGKNKKNILISLGSVFTVYINANSGKVYDIYKSKK